MNSVKHNRCKDKNILTIEFKLCLLFHFQSERVCKRQCQSIYYQNEYDADKHFGLFIYIWLLGFTFG